MASKPLQAIGRVIFWRYKRGGWQYDILCGLILAFIFLTPKSVFDGSYFSRKPEVQAEERTAPTPEPEAVARPETSQDIDPGR